MAKIRIDKLMVERGLSTSRERAQALLLAGRVMVNEQKIEKPGANVDMEAEVRILGGDLRYVSRGGLKLERALEHWSIDVTGLTCLDVGASTNDDRSKVTTKDSAVPNRCVGFDSDIADDACGRGDEGRRINPWRLAFKREQRHDPEH